MTEITSENYVEHAKKTDCVYNDELLARLCNNARLLHAAMGMCTEAAEMLDMLKKTIFYGKPLDKVNAKEELGDEMWYIALAVDELRTTINDVMTVNIAKLKLRYKDAFTGEAAINRDVKAERVLLETPVIDLNGYKDAVVIENNPGNNNWVKDRFETDAQHDKFVIPETAMGKMLEYAPNDSELSERGKDWCKFALNVLDHIENYTVPQYGDKGQDQVTNWSVRERLNQVTKYAFRYDSNQREGETNRDFLKMAHYTQLTASAHKGDM